MSKTLRGGLSNRLDDSDDVLVMPKPPTRPGRVDISASDMISSDDDFDTPNAGETVTTKTKVEPRTNGKTSTRKTVKAETPPVETVVAASVAEAAKTRTDKFAWQLVLGVMIAIPILVLTVGLAPIVMFVSWILAAFLGVPTRNLIAKALFGLLGTYQQARSIAVLAMIGCLVLSALSMHPVAIVGTVVATLIVLLLHLLISDIKAAAAQTGVIEARIDA